MLLLTRPRVDAEHFAQAFAVEAVIAPLTEIQVAGPLPDLGARVLLRSDLNSSGAEADFDTQVPRHRAQVAAQMGR